jgi:hypothetical protein
MGWGPRSAGRLRGPAPSSSPIDALIVALPVPFLIVLLLAAVSPGGSESPSPLLPLRYEAPFTASTPVIDGILVDDAWGEAPWTEEFIDILGDGAPTPPLRTRAKIAWDSTYLYVAAEMEEPHLWGTLEDRDAIIYRDNDFEIFIDPDGDGLAYFELEINALGTEFDLFLDRPYREGGSANIPWDMQGLRSAVRLHGTLNDPSDEDVGWTVEAAIPWEALRPPGGPAGWPPAPGDTWRINFSRVQWSLEVIDGEYRKVLRPDGDRPVPEDNWVWSPQGEINMHIPDRWGFVTFVARTDGKAGGAP